MKWNITLIIVIFSAIHVHAQWFYGGGMKYNANNEFKAIAINAKIGKDISEKFDLDLDAAYYIASSATWAFDVNLHYRFIKIGDVVALNPLAGVNFTKSSHIYNSILLGLSLKVYDNKYTYYLEPKWILNEDQVSISVGILF
ncbi:MAG TPA: hypothetical protein PK047_11205 [Saprospiraceae bacterium]|mgnify:CR=1 FL=1|nr:hypothetical protein [Saprospiraceae bacterium]HRP42705.1 hypothetical protein [Saprospiraceae bacterium]